MSVRLAGLVVLTASGFPGHKPRGHRHGNGPCSGRGPAGSVHKVALGEVGSDVIIAKFLQLDGIWPFAATLRHVPIAGVDAVQNLHRLWGNLPNGRLPRIPAELRVLA